MIVYIEPRAPFTKGVPRSDTLFGAVCWAIRLLYGESALQSLLAEFDRAVSDGAEPPFLLSSLFPYFEDEKGKILFLPRPLMPPAQIDINNVKSYRAFKKLRKVGYVSRAVFEQMANGRLDELTLFAEMAKDGSGYSLQSSALVTAEERERILLLPELVVVEEAARNAINRLSISTGGEGGQLYYQPIVSARKNEIARSGFYLFIQTSKENGEIKTMLKAGLRFLAEKGLGGDTSVGRGHFELEFDDDANIEGFSGGERLMTLSLFHPAENDREHLRRHVSDTYARMERRKGFIENAYINMAKQVWKPTLFMLGEGATFPRDGERRVYGSLYRDEQVRAGLDFQIRINGLACTVAMKREMKS